MRGTTKDPNSQSNLEKKEQNWSITLPDLKLYYKSVVIKTLSNKIESLEINLCISGQLIDSEGAKKIQWEKDSFFKKWFWENWKVTCRRMILDHHIILYKKINSKWIKKLNEKPETIKFLEENTISKFLDIGFGDDFVKLDTKSKGNKSKNSQVRLHQTRKLPVRKRKPSIKWYGNPPNVKIYLQIIYLMVLTHYCLADFCRNECPQP